MTQRLFLPDDEPFEFTGYQPRLPNVKSLTR